MMQMHFKKLIIWQKSMILAKEAYRLTALLPKQELYELSAQIRRSAVSIPSNIAEGSQRTSSKDFANFLLIAKGSLAELITQLLLAEDLGFLDPTETVRAHSLAQEIDKMMHVFHAKLVA